MSELDVEEAFHIMSRESFQLAYRSHQEEASLARMAEFANAYGQETKRSRFLLHRSIILEIFDRNDEAEADLKEAYELTDKDDYHRYALALGMLLHARRRGDRADAAHWIRVSSRSN